MLSTVELLSTVLYEGALHSTLPIVGGKVSAQYCSVEVLSACSTFISTGSIAEPDCQNCIQFLECTLISSG